MNKLFFFFLDVSSFKATIRHNLIENIRSLLSHKFLILFLGFLCLVFAKLYILNICGYLLLDFFVLFLILDFSLLELFGRFLRFCCRMFLLVYNLDEFLFGVFSLCDSFEFNFLSQFNPFFSILFSMFLFLFLLFLLLSLPFFGRFFHFLGDFLLLFFLFDFVLNKHFLEIHLGFFQLLLFMFFLFLLG